MGGVADQIIQVGPKRFAMLKDPLDESRQGTIQALAPFEFYPPNDEWTEPEYIEWGEWISGTGTGVVELDAQLKVVREHSIRHTTKQPDYYGRAVFTLKNGAEINCDNYPRFKLAIAKEQGVGFMNTTAIILEDAAGNWAAREETVGAGAWVPLTLLVGSVNDVLWQHTGPFDWTKVKRIMIDCHFEAVGTGRFWIDGIVFTYKIEGFRALDVTVVLKGATPAVPIQGAKVIYGHLVGIDPVSGKETYFWMDGEAKLTDTTGKVVFTALEPDWYGLKVTAKGFKEVIISDIDARNADPAPITVELEQISPLDIVVPIIVASVLILGGLVTIFKRL